MTIRRAVEPELLAGDEQRRQQRQREDEHGQLHQGPLAEHRSDEQQGAPPAATDRPRTVR